MAADTVGSITGAAVVGAATAGAAIEGTASAAGVFVGPLGMGVARTAAVGIASAGICGKPAQPESKIVNKDKTMISFFKVEPSWVINRGHGLKFPCGNPIPCP